MKKNCLLAIQSAVGKVKTKTKIWLLLFVCLLFCGFSWTWIVEFTIRVLFPIEEAVDTDMIFQFPELVDSDDLQIYLTEPVIAEQINQGIQANLSASVYDNIELPDMTEESLGSKIIRIIFDRIFS
ncbi:hypothetical protein B5F10_08930 [Anaerotruncus colihominis]|uniref:hypothetical protein n=1 Tax=Anaerotruncus colihominis TaxID=169435 RepID=UPI000B38F467|nr:hypothetical protein [Anaerotruncus colihominis]OUP74107.1 hypothetical protein B5F10_08930 [Anaerotruncus colihominis]